MKSRIFILFAVFLVAWAVLIGRAGYLQIFPQERLKKLGENQFNKTVKVSSRRGSIFDRSGRELGVSIPSYSLYADPKIIDNKRAVARKVARKLSLSSRAIYAKLKKNKKRRFTWLRRFLTLKQKKSIQKLKIRGLGFIEEPKRVYPNNYIASHVLGLVGHSGKGLEGLELSVDKYLRGVEQRVSLQKDARGRALLLDGDMLNSRKDGHDIFLTLDQPLQLKVEKELEHAIAKFDADKAMAVVLDANTSEILALANAPRFNVNQPFRYSSQTRRNHAVVDFFEPGSTMKTFVVAGAIKQGLVKPNTKIDCENGRFKIGGRVIREADSRHNHKELTVSEILAKSSNVGTTKLALMLKDQGLFQTLKDFGFGQKTHVELPGEVGGILRSPPWRPHLLGNISFGHGLTVNALQVATAYAAIANGGEYITPRIIKKVANTSTGEPVPLPGPVKHRVLTKEQSQMMRLMLAAVTSSSGTGFRARVKGFPVAGKTGTAQKVDLVNGGYKKGEYISSFVGFLPAHAPKYVVYIIVDNPRKEYYGSQVAAPVFAQIGSYLMRHSGMAPVLLSEKNVIVPQQVKTRAIDVVKKDFQKELQQNRVPDLYGLTLREVLHTIKSSNLKIKVKGTGIVTRTTPIPHEPLPKNKTVRLLLETPE